MSAALTLTLAFTVSANRLIQMSLFALIRFWRQFLRMRSLRPDQEDRASEWARTRCGPGAANNRRTSQKAIRSDRERKRVMTRQ
jgi:hypothetical protein